jgi:hypothetical protein
VFPRKKKIIINNNKKYHFKILIKIKYKIIIF